MIVYAIIVNLLFIDLLIVVTVVKVFAAINSGGVDARSDDERVPPPDLHPVRNPEVRP